MDPDALYRELMELIGEFRQVAATDPELTTPTSAAGSAVVDKVEDLNEWLVKGGYLPKAWETAAKQSMARRRREVLEEYPQASRLV